MAELTPVELEYYQQGMDQNQRMTFMSHYNSQKKDRVIGLALSIIVGEFGVDRFYAGDVGLGILKLVTFGGCLVWWFVDLFLIMGRIDEVNREKAHEIATMVRHGAVAPPHLLPGGGGYQYRQSGQPQGDPRGYANPKPRGEDGSPWDEKW